MRTEDFPISDSVLGKWIAADKPKLASAGKKSNGRHIYINLSMVRLQTAWLLPKILFALGMAEKSGADIVAVTWRPNEKLRRLLSSYGIGLISLDENCQKDLGSLFSAGLRTLGLLLRGGSGETLKKMKFGTVPAGRAIYEDILRTSDISTIRTIYNFTCIKKVFHLL